MVKQFGALNVAVRCIHVAVTTLLVTSTTKLLTFSVDASTLESPTSITGVRPLQ